MSVNEIQALAQRFADCFTAIASARYERPRRKRIKLSRTWTANARRSTASTRSISRPISHRWYGNWSRVPL
jgi:hypothetical protein